MAVGRVVVAVAASVLTIPLACGAKSVSIGGNYEDGTSAGGSDFGGTSGVSSTGGSATGGSATGGSVTGGNATGGSATGGSATGGSATGGGATGGCDAMGRAIERVDGVTLVPNCDGWVDTTRNPLGVQGGWYAFGDQYSGLNESKCTAIGMHRSGECSLVESPLPPPSLGFPQSIAGEMCTLGQAARVVPCAPSVQTSGCPAFDYANVSGAGIAFDFNAESSEDGGARHPWDPSDDGIIGFSFEIDRVPIGLRVELSMVLTDAEADAAGLGYGSTTDQHPDGSPYWGATPTFPASPVVSGVNRVLWDDIRPPRTNYVFDPRRMLGLEFHVPADPGGEQMYLFCIKNLTMLHQ